VKREVDEGVMNRIKVSFVVGGNSISSTVVAPSSGEMKVYAFDLSGYGVPGSVEVAPIFVSSLGKEKEGSVTSSVDLPTGTIREVPLVVYDLGRDYFYEVPTTGLVSWWKFDGDATDSVGGNDGDCTSCPDYVDDVERGNVASFDGVGDYVDAGSDSSLDLDENDFTIITWIKPQPQGSYRFVYGKWRPNIYLDVDDESWNFELDDGFNRVVRLDALIDGNTWYFTAQVVEQNNQHCAYIYNSEVLVDSGCVGVGTTAGSDLSDFLISKRGWHASDNEYFEGVVDDVMIYDRALSEEEVNAIYEVQKKV